MKLFAALLMLSIAGFASLGWVTQSSTPERVLAEFSTTFEGRLSDQRRNASLAAKKLNGLVVAPGAILSFNQRVGTWSRDQGYRKAPVSFSGTLISTWGGGVCQTSTTLYNAGLLAGLEVVERHSHQFAANYVPPGRDAAVAYNNIDVKFRNTYSFPIRITTDVSGDKLKVSILGRGTPKLVELNQQVLDVKRAASYQFGQGRHSKIRNPGKSGFEVQTFRSVDGQKEIVSEDSYPAMNRVVERLELQ